MNAKKKPIPTLTFYIDAQGKKHASGSKSALQAVKQETADFPEAERALAEKMEIVFGDLDYEYSAISEALDIPFKNFNISVYRGIKELMRGDDGHSAKALIRMEKI